MILEKQPPTQTEELTEREASSRPAVRAALKPTAANDIAFRDFGVLNDGSQSKGSIFTSVSVNILLLLLAIIVGASAKKLAGPKKVENLTFVEPIKEPPPPPPPPKLVPPKMPPPPKITPPEPKILQPEVKIEPPKVELPKPVETPKPAVTPAPPKAVVAAAAPKPVQVNLGQNASVANHDLHPSAVSLGSANNPIAPSNRPAVAAVDLGHGGLQGMPPGSGRGPNATAVSLGSGQPNGSLNGTGGRAVQGVKLGVTGGTGNGPGNGIGSRPQVVALGQQPAPPAAQAVHTTAPPVKSGPQVIFKPRPVYTAEAEAMHLEGTVAVRIHVAANGAVSVLGVTSGLGHGLDQSAVQAAQNTRFKPAIDASGNPVDWEGVVRISFQLAS